MEVAYFFPSCVWLEKLNFDLEKLKQDLDLFAEKGRLIERSNMAGLQYDNYLNADLSDAILRTFPRVEGKIVKNPFVYMWVNRNPKGARNSRHTHITFTRNLLLSGVYYVKVPKDSGRIRFYDPRNISIMNTPDNEYYNDSNMYNFVQPVKDMILFFPSWFEHDVEENKSNDERISIGFNIFPEVDDIKMGNAYYAE